MISLSPNRLLTGLSLAGMFAVTAACSGPSSLLTQTGPSALASSAGAAAGATFSPNPTEEPPPPPPLNGRFTGGGFQIGAVKVTRGFTIHCDNLLTNNLEVNWPDGNNFHMSKNTLTSVVCSRPDDPTPPASPVSRIQASAVGQCNNQPATISFILEDHGEPGTTDRAELIIAGAGTCNLTLPLSALDGGNIQAHFDQPHK